MQSGKKNRSTGATAMNLTSSRSHSIFTIVVECGESDARYGDVVMNVSIFVGLIRQCACGMRRSQRLVAFYVCTQLMMLG